MARRGQERALRGVRLLGDLARILRLAEQPRVLDRDRGLLRQPDEEVQVLPR